MKPLPDFKYLSECFSLNNSSPSGLIWNEERPRSHFLSNKSYELFKTLWAGKPAGSPIHSRGGLKYFKVKLGNLGGFSVHRIIYYLSTLENVDKFVVDHIDGNTLNNNISNLRKVSQAQNNLNSKISKNSISGIKGITFQRRTGKWIARIQLNKKRISLGVFENKNDAINAYNEASEKYHGDFRRTSN